MTKIVQFSACVIALGYTIGLSGQQQRSGYADVDLKPHKSVAQRSDLRGATQECVAEVNAATPIDLACSIPSGAKYYFELYAKNGSDGNQKWEWKPCQTAPDYLCPGANGSWWSPGELPETDGYTAIQTRIVPFSGATVRGRLKVTYQVP